MADEVLKHDANARVVGGGVTDDSDLDIVQLRFDPLTKRMKVDIESNIPTGLVSGRKTISVTNTAVRLIAATATCYKILITGLSTNNDVVVIGDSSVVFTEASRTGLSLEPRQSVVLEIDDPYEVYVNGTASDGVSFLYLT